jgi:hypothetical protein
VTLANKAITQDDTADKAKFDADDAAWTSLTLSPATPSHAIIRDTTTDSLIGYVVLGTTASNGGNYTILWAAAGIYLLA